MTAPLDMARAVKGRSADADGFVRLAVDAALWSEGIMALAAGTASLVSLWIDGDDVRMALRECMSLRGLVLTLPLIERAYPSVGLHHAPAIRLERAARDLYGVEPRGLPDKRPWLDHGVWTASPVARGKPATPRKATDYDFLPIEGPSLHQIPVGPVHAGIIEPGHFRFSASGELVVRLEERLGYVHKGIDRLAVGLDLTDAARLAGRISGDSTVAYAFAFALAAERCLGWTPPPRAEALRGVMAELERIANHVGDVGAICNDASVVAIQARCTLIREDVLATSARCFGHRLMMDRIVPGGVAVDVDRAGADELVALLDRVAAGFEPIVKIYDNMASLQDRTVTTGIVTAELAELFAAGGFVGRASGRTYDARAAERYAPYAALSFEVPRRTAGDVDARIWIRIDEIRQSLAILRTLLGNLPEGALISPHPPPRKSTTEAVATVEAFRGDVFIALRLAPGGKVERLHARDASWFQWPLLEAAIEGNIVADFPLCNKSFNCSYSGHDL